MCKERHRLVNEYAAAARFLSRAARKLGALHGEEFTQALVGSEATRAQCDEAREALLSHETDHDGCSGPLKRRVESRAAHCGGG
jgi:hypothetical protein